MFHEFKASADGLPLLDSFLKESARVSAFESNEPLLIVMQCLRGSKTFPSWRAATSIGTFQLFRRTADINCDWVCVPHRSMMRDSQYFQNLLDFDGFRFLKSCPGGPNSAVKPSKLTDVSDEWLV